MKVLNRNTPPQIQKIAGVKTIEPEKRFTNTGVPVYLLPGGSQDIVKVELFFKAGSIYQNKPLQAFATANMLRSGTISRSAADINNEIDFYGIAFQIEAQKDMFSIGFYSLTRYIEPAINLLFEILGQPVFPENELEILLKNRKQKHLINRQKISHLCRFHFLEKLFGENHPYGQVLTLEDFNHLTRNDLIEFYGNFLYPENCTCFIAGVYPDNIIDLINSNLEKYPWKNSGSLKKPDMEPQTNKSRKDFYLEHPDSLQSAIRIGCLMPPRQHSDYDNIAFINTLLGGYFGSRLMQNLRQDKGFTYGINSAVVSLVYGSYFFISSQVGREVSQQAIDEIVNEIRWLKEKPATQVELDLLKNHLSSSFLRSFDGPFAQLERFREVLIFDIDFSTYNDYLVSVDSISPESIVSTAMKYFNEELMIQFVVG